MKEAKAMNAATDQGQDPKHESTEARAPSPLVRVKEHTGPPENVLAHPEGLQHISQRIIELLATLHHELRTPLAVIQGYTSLLLTRDQQIAAEERREFLQMMQAAGTHLEHLTERLLEIAQLEAGAYEIQMDLVDIPPLARTAIARARHLIPSELENRFTFQLHCRNEAEQQTRDVPPVTGDGRSIQKALDYLLENAIRFSPEGGCIDIIVQPVSRQRAIALVDATAHTHSFLEICVCDFGIGIDQKHLGAIFEPFYRVDTTLTRPSGGSGLGLAICKHLVALHQGHLWAESCSAGGSAFHLWLPRAHEPADSLT
jgi:two-component system sensor histidine kinase BaeS